MDQEQLIALGEVALESAKLDYSLARVIAATGHLGGAHDLGWLLKPPRARLALNGLVSALPDWDELREFRREVFDAFGESDRLFRALAVTNGGERSVPPELRFVGTWGHDDVRETVRLALVMTRLGRVADRLATEASDRAADQMRTEQGPDPQTSRSEPC